jgi:hypothetical protein
VAGCVQHGRDVIKGKVGPRDAVLTAMTEHERLFLDTVADLEGKAAVADRYALIKASGLIGGRASSLPTRLWRMVVRSRSLWSSTWGVARLDWVPPGGSCLGARLGCREGLGGDSASCAQER